MIRQSDAKERQAYTPKFIPGVCGNCVNFKSDIEVITPYNEWCTPYKKEKNMRCGIGGFAVKKLGSCAEHAYAVVESADDE